MAQYSAFVVVLDKDIGEDECAQIINTFKMIRGVIDVKPVEKEPIDRRIEKSRLISEVRKRIEEKLNEI